MARPADETLRPRLLAAAIETFAERGYAATTVDAVGERAGVTKGGVYFHFKSKEALFFAAVDESRGELRAVTAVPAELRGVDALRRYLAGYLAFHFHRPAAGQLLRVLQNELGGRLTTRLRGDLPQEHRDLRARLRELLVRGVHDGSLFAADPAVAAFLLASTAEGVVQQWLTSPADAEPFCDAGRLATAIVAGYESGDRGPREEDAGAFRGPF